MWTIVYWTLMGAFLLSAALNLAHVRAGFLTSYLADVSVPALLYVLARELAPGKRLFLPSRLRDWLRRSPDRAAALIFAASAATELSQIAWPRGLFSGRFDPWDIAAYAAGLVACRVLDRRERPPQEARSSDARSHPPSVAARS